jgi:hypothetical protein
MYDTWLASVVIGRSVATIAELCFVAQWAVTLRALSSATGSEVGRTVSKIIVPVIAVAEICSWYSVITTSNIGHVIEESLWGISALMLIVSIFAMRPRCSGSTRYMLDACCVAAVAYVGYMCLVDVPMYWNRWLADEAVGRQYLSIAQGLTDVSRRSTVSYNWHDWQHEVTWMTLYFSVAVWLSIYLIHAPLHRLRKAGAQRTH